MYLKKILATIFLLLAISPAAGAAEYYASEAGAGAKDGSAGAPWQASAIPWSTLESGATDHTIYFFGESYTTAVTIRHRSVTNTLNIRPCSYSASCPEGKDGEVFFTIETGGNIIIDSISDNITLSGESSVGSGTRNMKLNPGTGRGIQNDYDASPTQTNIKIRYMEFTGATGDTYQLIYFPYNIGAGSEIDHNYFHDNTGKGLALINTARTGYGIVKFHHNEMYSGPADYLESCQGCDIYNNIFDASDATVPYDTFQAYSITGIRYIRVWNNYFDSNDQMIYLESAPSSNTEVCATPAACKTEHIRIFNNVFTCTDPQYEGGTTFFGGTGVYIKINNYNNAAAINGVADDIYIVNNTFANLQRPMRMDFSSDEYKTTFTDLKVINNIFHEASSDAHYDNLPVAWFNDGNATWALEADAVFNNNVVYRNSGSFVLTWLDEAGGVLANFASVAAFETAWPNYTDNINEADIFAETTNFTIGATSKAKDAGQDLSALSNMPTGWPFDKNGVSRPQGSLWDIGAYEYDGEGAPAATTNTGCTISGGSIQ